MLYLFRIFFFSVCPFPTIFNKVVLMSKKGAMVPFFRMFNFFSMVYSFRKKLELSMLYFFRKMTQCFPYFEFCVFIMLYLYRIFFYSVCLFPTIFNKVVLMSKKGAMVPFFRIFNILTMVYLIRKKSKLSMVYLFRIFFPF